MRELNRFAWFAAALVLVFCGTAAAGDFANQSVTFDLDVENVDANEIPTNEENRDTSGLALATGDRFEVEVHLVPVPEDPLVGLGIFFNDLDSNVVILNRINNEAADGWADNVDPPGNASFEDEQTLGFNVALATGTGLTDPNFQNGYVVPTSYVTTMRWEAASDIADTDEIVFTPSYVAFSDTSQGQDTIFVEPELTVSAEQIELGGSATVALEKWVPGFVINGTAASTIDWTVTASGAGATISVEGQSGLTFSTPLTQTSIVLESSGTGVSNVAVQAAIGDVTLSAPALTFEEATPVELASFGGEVVETGVLLNWATGSQTNNAGWRVLRSEDGENYAAVGDFVSGAGTTEELLNYSFNDASLPENTESVYYVLEQVDLDGTVRLSDPIQVLLGARFEDVPESFSVSAYPNPFNPSTTVSYDLPSAEQVTIVIYDVLGQEVRRLVDDAHAAGRYSIRWDARDNGGRAVGSGVYIARIDAGSFSQSQKMLLLK